MILRRLFGIFPAGEYLFNLFGQDGCITPQAMRAPAFPAGWEVKSSMPSCIITVLPMTSQGVKLPVSTARYALAPQPINGGISPT